MTAHFPMNLEKALMDKIYIISFTEKGAELSLKLQNIYPDALLYSKYPAENIKMLEKDIKSFTADIFKESKAVIFISAIGIAVRAVAPLIVSKDKDAAVIVLDDTGTYVIPVLLALLVLAFVLFILLQFIYKDEKWNFAVAFFDWTKATYFGTYVGDYIYAIDLALAAIVGWLLKKWMVNPFNKELNELRKMELVQRYIKDNHLD